jgi:(p)ppGpp synthase/HD superfamily hydrolase
MLKKKFTENFVKIMFENITDKSNVPYYEHLRIVAENAQLKAIKDAILSNDSLLKNTQEYYIVGLLHDTLEDIPYVTKDLIKGIYGKKVADAIVAITKLKGEEYQTYLNRVKSNLIATKVKIEDLKHNMDITRLLNTTEKDIERIIKYKDALSFLQTK